MNKKAFTIVEICIVIVILGILAALIIPQFHEANQKAAAYKVFAAAKDNNATRITCTSKDEILANLYENREKEIGVKPIETIPLSNGAFVYFMRFVIEEKNWTSEKEEDVWIFIKPTDTKPADPNNTGPLKADPLYRPETDKTA